MARLRLTIEGRRGEISLESFMSIMKDSFDILRELDRAVSHQRSGTLKWLVSQLGMGSTFVEAESRVTKGEEDFGIQVVQHFTNGVRQLQTEAVTPPLFSVDSIKKTRNIVRVFGRDGATGLHISAPDIEQEVKLTRESEKNLQALAGVHHKGIGAIEGYLELVSLHRPYRRFNVYHSITKRAIKCSLPEALEEKVIQNLGRRVSVSGIISYNIVGEPLSVQVKNIRTLGGKEDLPTISDILGMSPDFTEDIDTEDYIRILREGDG